MLGGGICSRQAWGEPGMVWDWSQGCPGFFTVTLIHVTALAGASCVCCALGGGH